MGDDTKTMGSSAVIASVLGSLLVVGIVLVVTNSNDVNAPAEAQQTELMWGDNSAPLGLVDGWNTSVGTAAEREAAARHFHVTIADDDSLWKHNVFTPFAGKTLKMVGIDILKRNAFNTLTHRVMLATRALLSGSKVTTRFSWATKSKMTGGWRMRQRSLGSKVHQQAGSLCSE